MRELSDIEEMQELRETSGGNLRSERRDSESPYEENLDKGFDGGIDGIPKQLILIDIGGAVSARCPPRTK